jgi:hypothetical protein
MINEIPYLENLLFEAFYFDFTLSQGIQSQCYIDKTLLLYY